MWPFFLSLIFCLSICSFRDTGLLLALYRICSIAISVCCSLENKKGNLIKMRGNKGGMVLCFCLFYSSGELMVVLEDFWFFFVVFHDLFGGRFVIIDDFLVDLTSFVVFGFVVFNKKRIWTVFFGLSYQFLLTSVLLSLKFEFFYSILSLFEWNFPLVFISCRNLGCLVHSRKTRNSIRLIDSYIIRINKLVRRHVMTSEIFKSSLFTILLLLLLLLLNFVVV